MYSSTIDLGSYITNFGGYAAMIITAAIILLLTVKIITN